MVLWPIDTISDDSYLYCYVHKTQFDEDFSPIARAFRNTPYKGGTDLSSDWDEYTTPSETLERLSLQKNNKGINKDPHDYGLVEFHVEKIRSEIKSQNVEHDPIQNHQYLPNNRAHTKIEGDKDVEIRLKMIDLCKVIITPKNGIGH